MTSTSLPAGWQEAMATGIAAVDNDHQLLLKRLEEFERLTAAGADKNVLCDHLEQFLALAKTHVRHEHHLARERGYGESDQHLAEDEKLLRLFEDVLLTLRQQDIHMNREAASFLSHLMVQHIYKTDEPLRRHFRSHPQPAPAFLGWSNLFLIGDPLIDSEHKVLVDYVNRLYELLAVPDNQAAVVSLLHSFLDHAKRHFHSEGQLLRRLALPDGAQHLHEHDTMLRQMQQWIAAIEEGAPLEREQVLQFVREWVVRHVLFVDMRLKAHLQNAEEE